MTNLTLTINLDGLTATQLAALHVIALNGMNSGDERKQSHHAILATGEANCGSEYFPEFRRVQDFLLNLDKEEA